MEYNLRYNIGKAKYVVNFHDGKKTHKDKSKFFDIRIFSNKKNRDEFIKSLKAQGYKEATCLKNELSR